MTKADLIDKLTEMAANMRDAADSMRLLVGFGQSERGRLLLMHAGELLGAVEMVDDWIKELRD